MKNVVGGGLQLHSIVLFRRFRPGFYSLPDFVLAKLTLIRIDASLSVPHTSVINIFRRPPGAYTEQDTQNHTKKYLASRKY